MFNSWPVIMGLGVIVLALLIPTGLAVWASKTIWKNSSGRVLQIFSIIMSSLAILIALICLGGATIWRGSSGEWAIVALIPAFLISLPAGLIALIIGLVTRRGVLPAMRRVAITMSVIAFVAPFLAAALAR